MNKENITVVVAMSGGVDSSVAAALLKEQGYNVIGMMMRLWAEETFEGFSGHNRCCTPDQMADARRIAHALDIPFYVIDTKDVFRQKIVQFFIDRHSAGVTPNPCMECNRHIRFEWLLNHALAMDADYLATGHYARVTYADDGSAQLRTGRDPNKDQSYVLSVLTQDKLRHAMFPIGDYEKPDVRGIAADLGLPVAKKSDSQDLCFIGDGDYRRFLRDHAADIFAPGAIQTRDGRVLGEHNGLPNYTIGQRKGLGIAAAEPLYVLDMDTASNVLIVGTKDELGSDTLTASRVNWISGSPPDNSFRAEVKIRYKSAAFPGLVTVLDDGHFQVRFDEPRRDITPGQAAVIYDGDLCLGGGIIAGST
ncbi:MAG TPA: tRNA 2-thiouridine(34) synthase MnmA [Aggregatilineales bacterium]|nr:tRNA 2-thiouridine(34) synthase MnmA [Aggregatilineales bacterium]